MPTPVHSLDGLISLLDFAVMNGVRVSELVPELRAGGVNLLEMSISGKKVWFAHEAELRDYVIRNAQVSNPGGQTFVPIEQRLDHQAKQIESLKQHIADLQSTRGAA